MRFSGIWELENKAVFRLFSTTAVILEYLRRCGKK